MREGKEEIGRERSTGQRHVWKERMERVRGEDARGAVEGELVKLRCCRVGQWSDLMNEWMRG